MDGKSFKLDVNPSETIESVKERLGDILHKPPGALYLIFDRKQLKDESTIDECNIAEESVVVLM